MSMLNCPECGVSCFEKPLLRVNEKGVEGICWCEDCIKKKEPELYNNLKEEESDVERDLKEIIYGK